MARKAVTAPAVVPKMTIAQAVRDVFIASINKGQFPFAIIGAIVLSLIWRMPDQEVADLVRWMVMELVNLSLLGWLLFAVAVLGWFFHAQRLRREFTGELERFYVGEKKKSGLKAPKQEVSS